MTLAAQVQSRERGELAQRLKPGFRHADVAGRQLSECLRHRECFHSDIADEDPEIAHKLASALSQLGSSRAVLVHAEEGLDELGLSGPSTVTEFDASAGDVRTYSISPEDVGLEAAAPGSLAGGDVDENTRITLAVLSGEPGPRRDVTLINAGAGIYAAEAAASIAEGVAVAKSVVDSGRAMERLEKLVALTRELFAEAEVGGSLQA